MNIYIGNFEDLYYLILDIHNTKKGINFNNQISLLYRH